MISYQSANREMERVAADEAAEAAGTPLTRAELLHEAAKMTAKSMFGLDDDDDGASPADDEDEPSPAVSGGDSPEVAGPDVQAERALARQRLETFDPSDRKEVERDLAQARNTEQAAEAALRLAEIDIRGDFAAELDSSLADKREGFLDQLETFTPMDPEQAAAKPREAKRRTTEHAELLAGLASIEQEQELRDRDRQVSAYVSSKAGELAREQIMQERQSKLDNLVARDAHPAKIQEAEWELRQPIDPDDHRGLSKQIGKDLTSDLRKAWALEFAAKDTEITESDGKTRKVKKNQGPFEFKLPQRHVARVGIDGHHVGQAGWSTKGEDA